ncbi:MAG: hypothetical protein FJY19_07880, partial [Bacteroidetes bacterium]|nr:hypothetical protein [Bacteroidota bacterium]
GCHWFKIILDNASIHGKSMREGIKAVLEELATRPGFETLDPVTLSFLSIPPYSPDYNPAEYIIHAVRQQSLYLVPYDQPSQGGFYLPLIKIRVYCHLILI